MKKVLMIALIIGFVFAGNAFADEYIYGFCRMDSIRIYDSERCADDFECGERIQACYVEFFFLTYPNGQFYRLDGFAYGTALNLALLKDRIVPQTFLLPHMHIGRYHEYTTHWIACLHSAIHLC